MLQPNINNTLTLRIAGYAKSRYAHEVFDSLTQHSECNKCESLDILDRFMLGQTLLSLPEVLLLEVDDKGHCFELIVRFRKNILLKGLIIVLLSDMHNNEWKERAKELKVHDYYTLPYPAADIYERLTFLVKFKLIRPTISVISKQEFKVRHNLSKRIFDICSCLLMLALLSPLLLLTAIMIRLESKGRVIYKSKRVGTGFKIFDFYKFRSMYPDADKRLNELSAFNQYAGGGNGAKTTFIKFKNDPRITRVGRFIRKVSIDELPQLFNILKGDMSMVGNRPLPIYEAELLTSDEWSWRFLAPAGLTGLWQISRRGRADMSERERKKLDNFYAKKYSILFDLKILARTLPAAFQKSDV